MQVVLETGKCPEVRFKGVQGGFLSERKRSFQVEGPEAEKAREPTVEMKSATWNLEAEYEKQSGQPLLRLQQS